MDLFTFIIGGKAGEGVKRAGTVASRLFSSMGRYTFQMDDYQSLIRGGHNFSVVSSDLEEVFSHHLSGDIVVALDRRSYLLQEDHLSDRGVIFYNSDEVKEVDLPDDRAVGIPMTKLLREHAKGSSLVLGVAGVTILAAGIGFTLEEVEELIKREYPRGAELNIPFAKAVYKSLPEGFIGRFKLKKGKEPKPLLTGNEAIALGLYLGGVDLYIAYPMTPSTSILHFLARYSDKLGVKTVQPENEIAVINMGIGAVMTGTKVAVGTSGGGFALMAEAFSLAGMVEAPIVVVVSSRPGPSTGVPTYTAQGDLLFVIYQGHGEFPRIVASPHSPEEALKLSAQLMSLAWKFQTPAVLLTEKHLSESRKTLSFKVETELQDLPYPQPKLWKGDKNEGTYKRYEATDDGISPLLFPPSPQMIKWNSYEHDEMGITTEDPREIAKMQEKRYRKQGTLERTLREYHTVNFFHRGKGRVPIFTYGSTTMSVLESLRINRLENEVVQPIYLEPFPYWELESYEGREVIVVEESSTGLFARYLRDKLRVKPLRVIKRYDGRPFEPSTLGKELMEIIK